MSFFDRREVRDVLAYLRVLHSPQDEISLLRIINTPPRGISDKTVGLLVRSAVKQGQSVYQAMCHADSLATLPQGATQSIREFLNLIESFRSQMADVSLTGLLRELLSKIDYAADLRRRHPDAADQESRMAAVEEVVNAVAAYEKQGRHPTLGGFLDDVSLGAQDFDREKEEQLRRNAIALMTLHSAKGLEFPHVYLVGLEEGILPHHRSLGDNESGVDEERRLCYVGMTRAQDRLTLSMPLTRMKWGKARDTTPSRFLYEIIGQADNPITVARITRLDPAHTTATSRHNPRSKVAKQATGTRRRRPGKN
jgi:DNA helicase-2/ATP-dependent DNA helicase PcrA